MRGRPTVLVNKDRMYSPAIINPMAPITTSPVDVSPEEAGAGTAPMTDRSDALSLPAPFPAFADGAESSCAVSLGTVSAGAVAAGDGGSGQAVVSAPDCDGGSGDAALLIPAGDGGSGQTVASERICGGSGEAVLPVPAGDGGCGQATGFRIGRCRWVWPSRRLGTCRCRRIRSGRSAGARLAACSNTASRMFWRTHAAGCSLRGCCRFGLFLRGRFRGRLVFRPHMPAFALCRAVLMVIPVASRRRRRIRCGQAVIFRARETCVEADPRQHRDQRGGHRKQSGPGPHVPSDTNGSEKFFPEFDLNASRIRRFRVSGPTDGD